MCVPANDKQHLQRPHLEGCPHSKKIPGIREVWVINPEWTFLSNTWSHLLPVCIVSVFTKAKVKSQRLLRGEETWRNRVVEGKDLNSHQQPWSNVSIIQWFVIWREITNTSGFLNKKHDTGLKCHISRWCSGEQSVNCLIKSFSFHWRQLISDFNPEISAFFPVIWRKERGKEGGKYYD